MRQPVPGFWLSYWHLSTTRIVITWWDAISDSYIHLYIAIDDPSGRRTAHDDVIDVAIGCPNPSASLSDYVLRIERRRRRSIPVDPEKDDTTSCSWLVFFRRMIHYIVGCFVSTSVEVSSSFALLSHIYIDKYSLIELWPCPRRACC